MIRISLFLLLLLALPGRPAGAQSPAPAARDASSVPGMDRPAPGDGETPSTGPTISARRDGDARPAGAPVVVGRDTLFFVQERLGPFSAAERARAVEGRIRRLARDPLSRRDSVTVAHAERTSDVLAADRVVLTITDADAAAAGTSRERLADARAARVRDALREEGFVARLKIIALGMLFALMTTLAVVVVIRTVNRIFPRLQAGIERGRTTWLPSLRIQNLELLSASQAADALLWILGVVRMIVVALLLYVTIPVVLSFFPWTAQYAERLFGYILTPFATAWAAFVGFIPNFFTIGAIILIAWYLLRLIRLFFLGIARGTISFQGFYPEWAIPTYKLVRVLVLVFAFIAIWPSIPGSDSDAFRGVGVFIGLLISLGSATAIGNVIGGVVITYMRPFRLGDRVKIADAVGDVVEKTLLVTRIRTPKNVDITIPNSMVLASHIVNYSANAAQRGVVLPTTVTIGYDVPWRQVHELLIGAGRATDGVLAEPAPFVLQTSLDDFFVSYELNVFTDQPTGMSVIYSRLHANIQDRFNEAGVEILSPHYRAARDGNASTVPAEYLPEGYRAPPFRVARPDADGAAG